MFIAVLGTVIVVLMIMGLVWVGAQVYYNIQNMRLEREEKLQEKQAKYSRQKGFTLIELMIVITIFGILLAIAIIPAYKDYITRSECVRSGKTREACEQIFRRTRGEIERKYEITCDNGQAYRAITYNSTPMGIVWLDEKGKSHELIGSKCEVNEK